MLCCGLEPWPVGEERWFLQSSDYHKKNQSSQAITMPRPLLQGHQHGWSARALLAGRRSAWPRRSAAATRPLIRAALAPLLSWLR